MQKKLTLVDFEAVESTLLPFFVDDAASCDGLSEESMAFTNASTSASSATVSATGEGAWSDRAAAVAVVVDAVEEPHSVCLADVLMSIEGTVPCLYLIPLTM